MRPTRILLAAAAATIVAVLLWNQPELPTPTSPPTPAASAATPPAMTSPGPTRSTPTPTALAATPEQTITPSPEPKPVDRRPSNYQDVAVRFLDAFARPAAGVTAGEWWARVEPMLTEQGAADYTSTDPRHVPFTHVTGPARLVPSGAPAELLTIALVPTDGGTYRVEMTTSADGVRVALAAPEEEQ